MLYLVARANTTDILFTPNTLCWLTPGGTIKNQNHLIIKSYKPTNQTYISWILYKTNFFQQHHPKQFFLIHESATSTITLLIQVLYTNQTSKISYGWFRWVELAISPPLWLYNILLSMFSSPGVNFECRLPTKCTLNVHNGTRTCFTIN